MHLVVECMRHWEWGVLCGIATQLDGVGGMVVKCMVMVLDGKIIGDGVGIN